MLTSETVSDPVERQPGPSVSVPLALFLDSDEPEPLEWEMEFSARPHILVPKTFEGSYDLLHCKDPEHDRYIQGRTLHARKPRNSDRTFERFDEISKGGLGIDFEALRAPYEAFRDTGITQPLSWSPGDPGTVTEVWRSRKAK